MREYTFKMIDRKNRDDVAKKMLEFVRDKKSFEREDIKIMKSEVKNGYIVSMKIADCVPTFVSIKTDNDSKDSTNPVVLMDTDFFPYELSLPNETEISISWYEDIVNKC